MSTTAVIALGGNLGDVPETFERCFELLRRAPGANASGPLVMGEILRSGNYVTLAIGENAGNDFINAAARFEVDGGPLDLLRNLQRIENELGRVRTTHWGPRTIDLDIVRWGVGTEETQVGTETIADVFTRMETRRAELILPHPACWYRRFVLDPWCEVDSTWVHPRLHETVQELRERLDIRPLRIGVLNSGEDSMRFASMLRQAFHVSELTVVETREDRRDACVGAPSDRERNLEIEFLFGPVSLPSRLSPRAILLKRESGFETALQTVRAALDQPKRLAESS